MKLSRRQRKWLRLLLILVAIRVVIGGLIWIFITYQFNKILQAVVNRETKGQYSFNAKDIDVSLWNRTILLKNSELKCNDTLVNANYYALTVSGIYFSLHSAMDLVLHKRLSVDSIAIISPDVIIHRSNQTNDTTQFRPAQIFDELKKVALHLKVRTLNIKDASFTLVNGSSKLPFRSTHIDLYVKDFSKKSGKREYLFSSEDVDLAIYNQDWQLPDGLHRISFKKLHFSSANQYFEMDSPVFRSPPLKNKAGFEFAAGKLFFNSTRLQDISELNELNLDTLLCYNPVLKIKTVPGDTLRTPARSVNYFFRALRFKYIAVNGGELVVSHENSTLATYIAQQANLKIFGLRIHPEDSVKMNIDSAHLVLNNIRFLSKDSLFQLVIREFTINRNEVYLSGATYGPTEYNKSDQQLFFTTPYLHLRNVDFEDLLQRKLTGSYAELDNPEITLRNNSKKLKPIHASSAHLNSFYKTMHELSDVIDVDSFRLIKANLQGDVAATSTHIFMHTMNATILLNRFLSSDSLIDIKRSVPDLTIQEMRVQSPKAVFLLGNYSFIGVNRNNHADYLTLDLSNGTRIAARKLYWEILDWDLFENHGIIQCDDIHVHELNVIAYNTAKDTTQKRGLPVINLGRLDVDSLHFVKYGNANDSLHFDARDICVDDIHTSNQFFLFGNALAELSNLGSDNSNTHILVKKSNISNEVPTMLRSIQYISEKRSGSTQINIPVMAVFAKIHSSDFSKFVIDSVGIDQPSIAVTISSAKNGASKLILPFQFETRKLTVHGAIFKMESSGDSMSANGEIDMTIKALASDRQENHIIKYEQLAMHISDFKVMKNKFNITLPQADMLLSNGNIVNPDKPWLTSSVHVTWTNADVHDNITDSSEVNIAHLAGTIEDKRISTETKLKLNEILEGVSLQNGSLSYEGKKWTVRASSFSWDPLNNDLHVRDFGILPRLHKDEYFKKNIWQCDYMEINGKTLNVHAIKWTETAGDTSIQIKKLVLDDVQISTSRDKRMPFQHGITKPMPTSLIEKIHLSFNIDTVQLSNSAVTVNEIALKTARQGTIEVSDLNATITGVNNRNLRDSLKIEAAASLFGSKINQFRYAERFQDTLNGFSMSYQSHPIQLTNLNIATVPLASLSVMDGMADTVFADWQGNKYAAIGNMHFYYEGLKIKILSPKNTSQSNIKLWLENMLANTFILRDKNNRSSVAWFTRDQEKFVFNYWVKTTLGGIISSVGFVKDSKYLEQYEVKRIAFSLPEYKKPE